MVFDLTALPDSLVPGDVGYDDAARVVFGAGRPAVIMRPTTRGDVVDAVLHARRNHLEIAVRSGGHGLLAHGTCDDGLVLDLGQLNDVVVLDPERRLVRVGGGATWGQVDQQLRPRGWAISSGDTAGVGVGGLTLGGGFGWLVRSHGLAIDNLVAARVVLADGSVVTASETRHPELFWALRGGGGNFGVVVDFDFVAIDAPTVHFGEIIYDVADPTELIAAWRDVMRLAPVELTSALVLPPVAMASEAQASVTFCVAGCTVSTADSVIEPLRGIGTVTRASIEERPYGDILEPGGPLPPGMRLSARNTLVDEFDGPTIAAVQRFRSEAAATSVIVRSLGGAFGEVPRDATAFAHRDAEVMVLAMSMAPAAEAAALEPTLRSAWADVAAHGSGVYLNFQGSGSAADLAAAYPAATYDRLVAVKQQYDAGNVFSRNHKVTP